MASTLVNVSASAAAGSLFLQAQAQLRAYINTVNNPTAEAGGFAAGY